MALKGTLRDFGIADIFQLIGQQTKSGVLLLRDDVNEVKVHFRLGAVVHAESSTRAKQMLLGNMLMSAGLINKEQLDRALQEQTRTVRRIGRILAEDVGAISEADLRIFVRLQLGETIYPLFLWQTGTYEFEQAEIPEPEEGFEPIRADTVLMEGLRRMDEWPPLRLALPPYSTCFDRARPMPEPSQGEDEFGDLDAAFGGGGEEGGVNFEADGPERKVYALIDPDTKLERLIYKSKLGEFETCRAIISLLDGGFIRPALRVPAAVEVEDFELEDDAPSKPAKPKPKKARPRRALPSVPVAAIVGRAFVYLLIVAGAGMLYRSAVEARTATAVPIETNAAYRRLASNQMEVIRIALEARRLRKGEYPPSLDSLAEEGYLAPSDLRYPFHEPYHYEIAESSVVLVAPFR